MNTLKCCVGGLLRKGTEGQCDPQPSSLAPHSLSIPLFESRIIYNEAVNVKKRIFLTSVSDSSK